ncbi:MAG: hypothetical protein FJX75_19820 [Armatimonadetes bacterium]|nr:hypothetical protein [Armatimonadota bacterium]
MLSALLTAALLAPEPGEAPDLALAPLAVVTGPRNASGSAGKAPAANDGDVTGYGPNHGYSWGWFEEPLVVTFERPTVINKVEVLLLDVDARAYDFRLEVRGLDEAWRTVAERTRASGWVIVVFEAQQCEAMRLVFTGGTLDVKSYHVVEVAAYNDPRPETDSALRKTWLALARGRQLGELALLGVDGALRAVFQDEAAFRRAKALPEGERRWVDLDRDGDPDLTVFRDQGAVIAALDDDDDAAAAHPQADRDSDCWVVDLDLDARPDRVIDYFDDDGDGDVDREQHYYLHFGWFGRRPGLVLVWDYDDNNRTWALNRYSYEQGRCQWDCDFGGNEGFSLFVHDPRTDVWEAEWECPFYFYDPDGDGLAEEALRLEGYGRQMRALRYSFNADNDAVEGQAYDYDCAIVALGPVELPEEWLVTTPLRVGRTGPYLPYATAREAVRRLPWKRALLVWDENDCNIDPGDAGRHERWEGIITSQYQDFPQIGGPPCGVLNKRYELDSDNSGGMELYASEVDGRLHLRGAEQGTMWVDADGNREPERIVTYRDADGDGHFDEWQSDDNADGKPDRTSRGPQALRDRNEASQEWAGLAATYATLLRKAVSGQRAVAEVLGVPLTPDDGNGNLEGLRWALENRVYDRFLSEIAAAQTASDTPRAGRYERAREAWQSGRFQSAVQLLARGAGNDVP